MHHRISPAQKQRLRAVALLEFEASAAQQALAAAMRTQAEYVRRLKLDRDELTKATAAIVGLRKPAAVLDELEQIDYQLHSVEGLLDVKDQQVTREAENKRRLRDMRDKLRQLVELAPLLSLAETELREMNQRVADATSVSHPLRQTVEAVLRHLGATRAELGLNFGQSTVEPRHVMGAGGAA